MVLEFAPDAPRILHAFAALLLFLHIAGGAVGIASGFVAIFARRGGPLHRAAGNVFFVGMLCMTGVGATVAPFLADGRWTNTTAGVFTFYLTVTGWMAARRRPGQAGAFEKAAFAVAATLALVGLLLIPYGLSTGRAAGFATIYVFCAIAGVAALGDYRLIRAGGIVGPARTARHLWRIGLAFAIAAGSFFLGQQDHLPKAVQGTFLPAIPPLTALGLMLFWLARTRLRGWRPLRRATA